MEKNFWWDYNIKHFLFYGCSITTIISFVAICGLLTLLAFGFEWLKLYQMRVRNTQIQTWKKCVSPSCENNTLLANNQPSCSVSEQRHSDTSVTTKHKCLHFLNDLVLWLIQQLNAYILMLSVMIFNGYILVAVVIGAALGYLIFGQTFTRLNVENIKIIRHMPCEFKKNSDETCLLRSHSNSSSVTEGNASVGASSLSTAVIERAS